MERYRPRETDIYMKSRQTITIQCLQGIQALSTALATGWSPKQRVAVSNPLWDTTSSFHAYDQTMTALPAESYREHALSRRDRFGVEFGLHSNLGWRCGGSLGEGCRARHPSLASEPGINEGAVSSTNQFAKGVEPLTGAMPYDQAVASQSSCRNDASRIVSNGGQQ